jgi:hypothetical protein
VTKKTAESTKTREISEGGAEVGLALSTIDILMRDPFAIPTGGYSCEVAAVYLACAVLFFVQGPGRFSLDALLFAGVPSNVDVIAALCQPNRQQN